MTSSAFPLIDNAVCPFCGCLCDDLALTVVAGRVTHAANACALGAAGFGADPVQRPAAMIDGRAADLDAAVARATQILAAARYPLIGGLTATTSEAQQAAVALADRLGATIDATTALGQGAVGFSFQGSGDSTATLGDVRNRADLVLFWGVNPAETHPRLLSRYAVTPSGMFVARGRADRTVVVVGEQRPTDDADLFLPLKPGSAFEVLWALRALVQGKQVEARIEAESGVSLSVLTDLVERLKRCTYGALFYGEERPFDAAAVRALVTALNAYTHFVALPLRTGNAAGAANVQAWQTGYPAAVNFGRGYPRHNPGEFSAADLLARGEADAALLVGADVAAFAPEATAHLGRIPTIAIGPQAASTGATVAITTAAFGLHTGGTVYRMDNVALSLRPAGPSPYPNDAVVLRAILDRLGPAPAP